MFVDSILSPLFISPMYTISSHLPSINFWRQQTLEVEREERIEVDDKRGRWE